MVPDTVLLDADLRVRSFTPGAAVWLGADAAGRSLDDIQPALVADARAALADDARPARDTTGPGDARRSVAFQPLHGDDGGLSMSLGPTNGAVTNGAHTAAEFQALVEASAQIVWRADAQGGVSSDSPSWRAYTGQTLDGWLGGRWDEVVHPSDLPGLGAAWAGALERQDVLDVSFRLHHAPTGAWRWVHGRAAPLFDADGTFRGHLGMTIDVHDARMAAEALRASEHRFRALVEASSQIVWQTDAEGKSVGESPTWCAYTGQTREEWLGDGWIDVVHPEDRGPLFEIWKASVVAEGGYEAEFRVHHAASGTWRIMAARAVPLRTPEGAFDGHIGMNVDVTDQRAAAHALRASERRFREMAELVPGILFTVAPDGGVDYVSGHYQALTGVAPAADVHATKWQGAIHPDDQGTVHTAWDAALADRTPVEVRYRLLTADGTDQWTLARARPVSDADGTFAGWVGATVDIDDLVSVEQALQRANESLEARVQAGTARVRQLAAALTAAEQTERRRIAQVLHDDLQQQLFSAAMLLTLLRPVQDEKGADLVDRCARIIDHATSLGRSLTTDLSPTVIESGDVCDIAEWLAQDARDRYELVVKVDAAGPCPVPSLAVRSLVYQALREVLFNVAKHAGAALTTVALRLDAELLVVRVTDDGRGFDPSQGLSGFGLESVRDRLALVGGSLTVDSALGSGTRVQLEVPTDPAG